MLRKGILTGKIGIGQASLFIRRWPAKPDGGYWLGGMTQKNRMKILFLPPFRMMKDVKKIKAISCELSAAS